MKQIFAAAAFVLATGIVVAADFHIKNGSTGWNVGASYEEGSKPGAGDVVHIPAVATVTVGDGVCWFSDRPCRPLARAL